MKEDKMKAKPVVGASVYDGLCSSIQNQIKQLFADDTINKDIEFAWVTVKIRSTFWAAIPLRAASIVAGFSLTI